MKPAQFHPRLTISLWQIDDASTSYHKPNQQTPIPPLLRVKIFLRPLSHITYHSIFSRLDILIKAEVSCKPKRLYDCTYLARPRLQEPREGSGGVSPLSRQTYGWTAVHRHAALPRPLQTARSRRTSPGSKGFLKRIGLRWQPSKRCQW